MPFKSIFGDVKISSVAYGERLFKNLYVNYLNNPDKVALMNASDENDKITYKKFYFRIMAVVNFLKSRNFGRNDIACLIMSNCWEYVVIFIAVLIRGGCVASISNLCPANEIIERIHSSTSKILFISSYNGLKNIVHEDKIYDNIKAIVVTDSIESKIQLFWNNIYNLKDLFNTSFSLAYPVITNSMDDLMILPYSSGTTGLPKGVMITHKNFDLQMSIFLKHFNSEMVTKMGKNWNWSETYFSLHLPFHHLFGIFYLNYCLLNSSIGIIMDRFNGSEFCKNIEKYRIRFLWVVPPTITYLANDPVVSKYDLSSLEWLYTAGAPICIDHNLKLKQKLPNIKYILQGYGMTECGNVNIPVICKKHFIQQQAVGKLAPNFEIKIVDPTTHLENGHNIPGEIWLRGPSIMLGYFNHPKKTQETIDENGWLQTGDIGYMDNDGCLMITGRIKEIIKVRGFQVSPSEIENVLQTHPDIIDCAVIGLQLSENEEAPKAFIVKKKSSTLSEPEIFDFVKAKVSAYKRLTGGIEFVDVIPRTASGKIQRNVLRMKSIENNNIIQ